MRLMGVVSSLVAAVLFAAGLFSGCGAGQGGNATTSSDRTNSEVLTIEQALLAERGTKAKVRGALLAPAGGAVSQMVLASVLLESYPPQAGGATVGLRGLDLEDLVGLSSTSDHPELAQVVWSDYWMVLGGVIKDGSLEVQETPRIVASTVAGATVRFSPVSEPIASGDTVRWAFDVKNSGSTPLQLNFSSGQHADVVLSQNGVEKYRWSAGKVFTEAVENIMLQPGQVWPTVVNDTFEVPPGDYDLTATVTADISGGSTGNSPGNSLPQLVTTITVH